MYTVLWATFKNGITMDKVTQDFTDHTMIYWSVHVINTEIGK